MLTKLLIVAGVIGAVVIMFFKQRNPVSGPAPKAPPLADETVRCEACGAWRMAGEPCLCGHSWRD